MASCAISRPDAVAHRRHQHLGRGEERQVPIELALDRRRIRAELVEHREQRLEDAIGGEERVRQDDPPDDRAADVALVPLVAGERSRHRQMAAQHRRQPLMRSHERVFILCGIADEPTWPGAKPSVTSS